MSIKTRRPDAARTIPGKQPLLGGGAVHVLAARITAALAVMEQLRPCAHCQPVWARVYDLLAGESAEAMARREQQR